MTPETRAKISASLLRKHQDVAWKSARDARIAASMRRPDVREAIAEGMRRAWRKRGYRLAQADAFREGWRKKRDGVECPVWVPDDLRETFLRIADKRDEFAAASVVRRLKGARAHDHA